MAKGENAAQHRNREYWSRRPFAGIGWGKAIKRLTHRQERRVEAKREIKDGLE